MKKNQKCTAKTVAFLLFTVMLLHFCRAEGATILKTGKIIEKKVGSVMEWIV